MNTVNPTRAIVMLTLAAAAAACSGNNDNNAPPAPTPPKTPAYTVEVPAGASNSVMDFINYLKSLVVAAADTLEPVDVSKVTPKTDDTIEPSAVVVN